jgi:hypothetical protein
MDKSIVACSAYIPRTAAMTERAILVGETRGGRWNLRNKATHSQFLVHKKGCRMLRKLLFNVHGEFVADDYQIIWIHCTLLMVMRHNESMLCGERENNR